VSSFFFRITTDAVCDSTPPTMSSSGASIVSVLIPDGSSAI